MTITTEPTSPAMLTVSDVAAGSKVAPSAVRFYEKHGIVDAVRTGGNQRRFDGSAVCRIQIARLAQQVGLTVREIADLFAALPSDPAPEDWGVIADRLVTEAERRVDDLRAHLSSLSSGARLCELGAAIDS
ncbi:MerR family transcriptional regulator [Actinophytocola sediminis]